MKMTNALWAAAALALTLVSGWSGASAQDRVFQLARPAQWSGQQTAAAEDSAPAAKPVEWAPQGEQTCFKCHEEPQDRTILFTAHGVRGDKKSPMAQHACESCHGPSPEHNNARPPKGQKRPPVDVAFKGEFASPVDKRNKTCATCHMGGEHINWPGSAHQSNDVACTDCHTNHTIADPVMNKKTETQVCFNCHTQQRSESYLTSHHPVREGKVGCSDCHNSHGSGGQSLLKEFTLNETCYACHAEQRGPFLWEHEPVREDCSTCHQSHGSTQQALLKVREPFLCMTCHQNSRANHEAIVSGGNQLPGKAAAVGLNLMVGRGCENCHSKVHGSNAPSGNMLTH